MREVPIPPHTIDPYIPVIGEAEHGAAQSAFLDRARMAAFACSAAYTPDLERVTA